MGSRSACYYNLDKNWNFGFSYKSPIYQERWSFNSSNPSGSARYIGIQAGLPEIISLGVAYKGLPKTLIDVDFRYLDYKDTPLFGQSVKDGGLGWQSVFAVAAGVQYQFSEKMTLRAGYLFNTNPIRSEATLFNVQAPGITTNTLSMGGSYQLTDNITTSAAWIHGFRNSIQGGVEQLPGAFTRLDTQTDSLIVGLNIRFGGMRKIEPSRPAASSYDVQTPASYSPPVEPSLPALPAPNVADPAPGGSVAPAG